MSMTRPYVRDKTDFGQVVLRWGDETIMLAPKDALDLAVRILNVRLAAHPDPFDDRRRISETALFTAQAYDDLEVPRRDTFVHPKITTGKWGTKLEVHLPPYFREQGYDKAQADIRGALGFNANTR